MERELLNPFPQCPVTACIAMVQTCAKEGLYWILGSISLQRVWLNTEKGFLEISDPKLSVFKRHLDNTINKCFSFWSALKWSGSWSRWSL